MNNEKQPAAHMMEHYHVWHVDDFEDMWRVMVERKGIIFFISALAVLAALAYIILVPPVYKAEVYLLPPLKKDIVELHAQGVGSQGNSTRNVYEHFVRNLRSRKQQALFFTQHKLAAQGEFKIIRPKKRKTSEDKENVRVVFESLSAQGGASANAFVKMVERNTVKAIVQSIMAQVATDKRDLANKITNKISIKRDKTRLYRNNYISRLNEAIELADRLGIVENSLLVGGIPERDSRQSVGPFPMYLRGVKALRAEREIVKETKNDDMFISGLIRLNEKMTELESVKIDEARVSVMTLDQEARVPGKPIKPKATLVLLFSLFAGLILGTFAAFYAEHSCKIRKGQVND